MIRSHWKGLVWEMRKQTRLESLGGPGLLLGPVSHNTEDGLPLVQSENTVTWLADEGRSRSLALSAGARQRPPARAGASVSLVTRPNVRDGEMAALGRASWNMCNIFLGKYFFRPTHTIVHLNESSLRPGHGPVSSPRPHCTQSKILPAWSVDRDSESGSEHIFPGCSQRGVVLCGRGVVNEWRKQEVQWTNKAVSRMSVRNLPS